MAKKKQSGMPEELLEQALVPDSEQPYEVPENWVWALWKTCGTLTAGNGFSPASQGFTEFDIPFYKVGSLKYSDQNGYLYDRSNMINEDMRKSMKATLLSANSLIFAKIGEAIRLNRRSLNEVPCCIDNNLMAFIPFEVCNYRYSYYWSCNQEFYNLANATTVPAIRKSDLEALPFPLPPLSEQQRIVDRIESLFEKLDQAKGLIQDALDSFENRKAAILHKAFSGELTRKWREENGVGMESWEEVKLSDVCLVNPKRVDINALKDELPVTFIPMQAVSDVLGVINQPQERCLGEVKKGYTNFRRDDVIFAKITPCMENGKSAIVGQLINDIGFGSTEFHVLRCMDKLNNKYLYHLVRSQFFRDEAQSVMTGAVGQQRVSKNFIEDYEIKLPTLQEQHEIVRLIDVVFENEQKAFELYDLIEMINLMKKAILARAFRGELGTNDPAEESALELLKEVLGKFN